jgi:hypothetical protein
MKIESPSTIAVDRSILENIIQKLEQSREKLTGVIGALDLAGALIDDEPDLVAEVEDAQQKCVDMLMMLLRGATPACAMDPERTI